MRLFLAVELPEILLEELEAAVAPLREEAPELAWVSPRKRHLTLKFLGDVERETVPSLVEMTDRIVRGRAPFAINLREVGAFPNFRRARVVWIGVEQEPRLELLQHDVEVACELAGFELDGRPFRPHVTLARRRSALPVERAKQLRKTAKRVTFTATLGVEAITLFESVPGAGSTPYARVHVAQLGGR